MLTKAMVEGFSEAVNITHAIKILPSYAYCSLQHYLCKYNIIKTKNKKEKKLMLHAYKIKFLINDKKFTYKAELPDYFNNYLNKKRLII